MNAERLHELCVEVKNAVGEASLVPSMDRVAANLGNLASQPQNSDFQRELSTSLSALYEILSVFPTDAYSPAWREVLEEIGAADVLGERLADRVREIVEQHQITPATAQEEVLAVVQELGQVVNAMDNVISGFSVFHIARDVLAPGECEVGVLIPRTAVDDGFAEFVDELRDFQFIFSHFGELVDADEASLQVRTISSSDLMVFLAAAPGLCALIAKAAKDLTDTYKNLLDIKEKRHELKDLGLSGRALKGVDAHANRLMDDRIEALAIEIVQTHYEVSDDGRKNELVNGIRISLRKLANKIDRGFNIEVRAEPLSADEDDDSDASETDTLANHIQIVMEASKALRFIKTDGEPILHLPESNDEHQETESDKQGEDRPGDEANPD